MKRRPKFSPPKNHPTDRHALPGPGHPHRHDGPVEPEHDEYATVPGHDVRGGPKNVVLNAPGNPVIRPIPTPFAHTAAACVPRTRAGTPRCPAAPGGRSPPGC